MACTRACCLLVFDAVHIDVYGAGCFKSEASKGSSERWALATWDTDFRRRLCNHAFRVAITTRTAGITTENFHVYDWGYAEYEVSLDYKATWLDYTAVVKTSKSLQGLNWKRLLEKGYRFTSVGLPREAAETQFL